DYMPKRDVARGIAASKRLILTVNLGNTHWVLCVIEHAEQAATSMRLMDSMPSNANTARAQDLVSAFVKHYLPKTNKTRQGRLRPTLSNTQSNISDCGTFVFVFALFAITEEPLPAHVDCRFWRRVMAEVISGNVVDLNCSMPRLS
ncbi:hypothetical protein LY78DRAFT_552950, partial [Colletotrichum sublineola]